MGRIAADGEVFVDVDEAAAFLNTSRRTIFNRIKSGRLSSRKLEGSKKLWLPLSDLEREVSEKSGPRGSPEVRVDPGRMKWLRRWHPEIFP